MHSFVLCLVFLIVSHVSACMQTVQNNGTSIYDTKQFNITLNENNLKEKLKLTFTNDIINGGYRSAIVKVTIPSGVSLLGGWNECGTTKTTCSKCSINKFMFLSQSDISCTSQLGHSCEEPLDGCTSSNSPLTPPSHDPNDAFRAPQFFKNYNNLYSMVKPSAGDYYFLYTINGRSTSSASFPSPPSSFSVSLDFEYYIQFKDKTTVIAMTPTTDPECSSAVLCWKADLGVLKSTEGPKYFSYQLKAPGRQGRFSFKLSTDTNAYPYATQYNAYFSTNLRKDTLPSLANHAAMDYGTMPQSDFQWQEYYENYPWNPQSYVNNSGTEKCDLPQILTRAGLRATDFSAAGYTNFDSLKWTGAVECSTPLSGVQHCGNTKIYLLFEEGCVSGAGGCPEFVTSMTACGITIAISGLLFLFAMKNTKAPAPVKIQYFQVARVMHYLFSLCTLVYIMLPDYQVFLWWKLPAIVGIFAFSWGFERRNRCLIILWLVLCGITVFLSVFNLIFMAFRRYDDSHKHLAGVFVILGLASAPLGCCSTIVGILSLSNWRDAPNNNVELVQVGQTVEATPTDDTSGDVQEGIPMGQTV